MPRKPVHLEQSGGKAPRQYIWEKIRDIRSFKFPELVGSLPGSFNRSTVRSYVEALVLAGYLKKEGETLSLVRDCGLEAPRLRKNGLPVTQGLAQENMWRIMLMEPEFNIIQLAAMSSTTDVQVTEAAAKSYCAYLAKAGYLIVIQKGQGTGKGGIPTRFRLIPSRWTGPRAPMIQRTKCVYDPNEHKIVWPSSDAILEEIDNKLFR